MEQLFEKASRLKLRFKSQMGLITVEDLWDLNLTSLDSIAKDLNRQIKAEAEESFITVKSKANTALELAFDIVKHVIKVKLEEAEVKKLAAEKKARKAQIMELISQKQNEALSAKSIEELQAELDNL